MRPYLSRSGSHAEDDFPYFEEQYRGGRQRWPTGPAVALAGFRALVCCASVARRAWAVLVGRVESARAHHLVLAAWPCVACASGHDVLQCQLVQIRKKFLRPLHLKARRYPA